MIILGIDCGTRTGWALVKNGKIFASGVQTFSRKNRGMLYWAFSAWLKLLMRKHKISLVCYERPHMRGYAATTVLINLAGRIEELSAHKDIPCYSVHSKTLKKFATGNGNAEKKELLIALKKYYNKNIIDNNESDACWVALYTHQKFLR